MNTWNIDSAHSEIGFKIKHLMISTVKGKFTSFKGSIEAPEEDLTKAKISFTAQVTSINTGNEMRDKHLQSPDFFNTVEFPTLSFQSKSITKKSADDFKVTGEFTMHGITKEISFDAKFNGTSTDMDKNRVMGFEISGTLSRKEFGLTWNAPTEKGGVVVSDEVKLDINIELKEIKQK
jgi:polyisoprenoid-binding protein YceI